MTRLALAVIVALGAAAGCGPSESPFFYEERFESLCSGSPCGWTVGAGPVGSVLWVETLPGEHGIALYGDRVAALGPADGEESESGLDPSSLVAYVAARCDVGATLEVEISIADLTTGAISAYRGSGFTPSDWTGGRTEIPLSRVGTGGPTGAFFRDMVAIRLLKSGPGVCEVDEIGITALSGFGR